MSDSINLQKHSFSDEHLDNMVEVFKNRLASTQDLRKAVLSVLCATQFQATDEETKTLLELRITPAQRKFLICLIDSPGKIVSKATIMDALYFPNDPPTESYNVARQYSSLLRRVIKRLGWTIVSYKDYGYMLQRLPDYPNLGDHSDPKITMGDNKIPLEAH